MSLHTGTVSRPRYESRPYRPCPARREHIHGKLQPLNDEPGLGGIIGSLITAAVVVMVAILLLATPGSPTRDTAPANNRPVTIQ